MQFDTTPHVYKATYDGNEIKKEPLQCNGDFRSEECIDILDKSDIVVTNPPFSLFRDFVATLIEHDKQFLIIGNINALAYANVFELFMKNKIRTGYTHFNTGMCFLVPNGYQYAKEINGQHFARVSTSCWFTSLPKYEQKKLKLVKRFDKNMYPRYHNYDAINVKNINEIPMDYNGIMGIPITFRDKYNPSQIELLGMSSRHHSSLIPRLHPNEFYNGYTRGKVKTNIDSYMPLMDSSQYGGTVCKKENCPDLYQLYFRVFIKNRHHNE